MRDAAAADTRKESLLDRRTLTALAAAAFVARPTSAAAQPWDPDTCRYGGTLRAMFEMMTAGFVDLPSSDASDFELAFGLYRLSAIGRAGHEVLSALEPGAAIAETHELLLNAMSVLAGAEPDLRVAITRQDADALSRAMTVAEQAWDLLTAAQNAGGTLPETGTACARPEMGATPGAA